jgi:GTP-sensing pleiotropic transcriptional regulator CodY
VFVIVAQRGKHVIVDKERFSADELLLMDQQDLTYLQTHQTMEKNVSAVVECLMFVLSDKSKCVCVCWRAEIAKTSSESARAHQCTEKQTCHICR